MKKKEYFLLLSEENEPFLLFEENGVFYPASDEAAEALLPDLADMLEGFSHFSSAPEKITMLE